MNKKSNLLEVSEFQSYVLQNGIRLIHKYTPLHQVAHMGVLINTGSRDELPDEHGMAHFIEHVFFKGTNKRKAHHILNCIEDVGGELNAYTTKEETCLHSSFLYPDFKRVAGLLSDILMNSTFPPKELEKEKSVILDEINSYKDSPSEYIFDEFEEMVFNGNPIGRQVLGNKKILKSFTREKVGAFIAKNYRNSEIVVSIIGNFSMHKAIATIENLFGNSPFSSDAKERIYVDYFKPSTREVKKNTFQSHCLLGTIAYSYLDDKRLGLYLLNNLLGGPGFSSRLNVALREKRGFTYNIESHFSPYSDTGLFSVYFGSDEKYLYKSIEIIHKEFSKLKCKPLGTLQLSKARKQILGQLAMSAENHESLMLAMAKSMMVYNKVDDFKTIVRKIEALTPTQLMDIANEILEPANMSMLIYK